MKKCVAEQCILTALVCSKILMFCSSLYSVILIQCTCVDLNDVEYGNIAVLVSSAPLRPGTNLDQSNILEHICKCYYSITGTYMWKLKISVVIPILFFTLIQHQRIEIAEKFDELQSMIFLPLPKGLKQSWSDPGHIRIQCWKNSQFSDLYSILIL